MRNGPRNSPLRGKYLIRNRYANLSMQVIDSSLHLLHRGSLLRMGAIPPARRVLVSNIAHLGDVLNSSAVLPLLKEAFPSVEIGFLAGSWATPLLENNPMIRWIHVVDHWYLNRSPEPLFRKFIRYRKSAGLARREIQSVKYDVAVDLYFFFPNAIPLLYSAKIPNRVGYTSGGFGPLLTHGLDWTDSNRHITDYYASLLEVLGVRQDHELSVEQTLDHQGKNESIEEIPSNLDYVVFHIGTGNLVREWPLDKWHQLARKVQEHGLTIIFTGKGESENAKIEELKKDIPNTYNLCNKLSMADLFRVIKNASLLVAVESFAGHIAAACGVESVVIMSGTTNSYQWRPLSPKCTLVMGRVPCAPCYLSRGCEGMECLRDVTVEEVLMAVSQGISKGNRSA